MSYMHIDNLYKNQTILMFRECYALEKIHGTSAHVSYREGVINYSPGNEKVKRFQACFDHEQLMERFKALGYDSVCIFGEAHGGKQQGMSGTYGSAALRFVAFDVRIDDMWLNVPNAHDVCGKLLIGFVHYARISTDLSAIDGERDAPSVQAVRNGVMESKIREGVVLRPLIELIDNGGKRVMAKHKREEFRETATPRPVVDPARMIVLDEANAIAFEWVTDERLRHVLGKLPVDVSMAEMPMVIASMQEDVARESAGEVVLSKEANKAIGRRTAELFKKHL